MSRLKSGGGVPPAPDDLPVPVDDGAASHLVGQAMPSLRLGSTDGGICDVKDLAADACVLYVFPRMGAPGEGAPAGWYEIPGAAGCTQQSCSFRDRHEQFTGLGYRVAGLSAQPVDEQSEAVDRLNLPFPLLADPDRQLGRALSLPVLEVAGMTLYKRLTIVARQGRIVRVFYLVFPPAANPGEVLDWIHAEGLDGQGV